MNYKMILETPKTSHSYGKCSSILKKCKHLHLGSITTDSRYFMPSDTRNVLIEKVEKEKDLGVIIDPKLNFRQHIANKVSIANRNLGIIFRTFTHLSQEMFLNLYVKG